MSKTVIMTMTVTLWHEQL